MADYATKEKVRGKLNLAEDIKEAKIKTSIRNVEKVDGKVQATFEITGLPGKKGEFSDTYKTIPKIFDTIKKFTEYTNTFFNASDEEIIKMCKASY